MSAGAGEGGRVPYRPSCGSEGADFADRWCSRCVRDLGSDDGEGCPILGDTFIFNESDPDYPVEWREDGPEGPRCTAFSPINAGDQPRCPLTRDLFA